MKGKKRLIVSVLTLVFALALATTTTFAWFSMNSTVKVETLDLGVTSDSGIMIATAKGGAYKSTLDTDDFLVPGSLKLNDLTPMASTLDASALSTNGLKYLDGTAATAGTEYYAFSLWVRSGSAKRVSVDEVTFTSTAAANNISIEKWWAEEDDEDALNAFVTDGIVQRANAKDAARIFIGGTANNVVYMNPIGADTDSFSVISAVNAAHSYYEYLNSVAPAINATAATEVSALVAGAQYVDLALDADGMYYAEIPCIVWIEGTDADCFDYILGDTLQVEIVINVVVTP